MTKKWANNLGRPYKQPRLMLIHDLSRGVSGRAQCNKFTGPLSAGGFPGTPSNTIPFSVSGPTCPFSPPMINTVNNTFMSVVPQFTNPGIGTIYYPLTVS